MAPDSCSRLLQVSPHAAYCSAEGVNRSRLPWRRMEKSWRGIITSFLSRDGSDTPSGSTKRARLRSMENISSRIRVRMQLP